MKYLIMSRRILYRENMGRYIGGSYVDLERDDCNDSRSIREIRRLAFHYDSIRQRNPFARMGRAS